MKKSILIALVLFFTSSSGASAEKGILIKTGFYTGNDYLQWSEEDRATYAAGFANGLMMAPLFGDNKKHTWVHNYFKFYQPSSYNIMKMIDKYLEDNPAEAGLALNFISFGAFRELCPNSPYKK